MIRRAILRYRRISKCRGFLSRGVLRDSDEVRNDDDFCMTMRQSVQASYKLENEPILAATLFAKAHRRIDIEMVAAESCKSQAQCCPLALLGKRSPGIGYKPWVTETSEIRFTLRKYWGSCLVPFVW